MRPQSVTVFFSEKPANRLAHYLKLLFKFDA